MHWSALWCSEHQGVSNKLWISTHAKAIRHLWLMHLGLGAEWENSADTKRRGAVFCNL